MAPTLLNRLHFHAKKVHYRLTAPLRTRSFAQHELDRKLAPYLSDIEDGFFVEAGANDGLKHSNTLYFEIYHGWDGLLIEAVPELYEQCRENRPACRVEHCALVAEDYPHETVEVEHLDLWSVVNDPSIPNRDKHVAMGKQFVSDDARTVVNVPAHPLSDVLENYGIDHVDFLSLDVEGYEEQVLRGLIPQYLPHYMLVEVRDRSRIDELLSDHYNVLEVLRRNKSFEDVLYERMA